MTWPMEKTLKKKKRFIFRDLPGGLVVKNLPANAGDMDSIPGLGRPHVPQGNSLCTTTTEALEPVLCSNGSRHNEKPMHHKEE